jgi:drug/metabolite transporter (DMT)-like permease
MIVGGAHTDGRWGVLRDSVIGLVDETEVMTLRRRARWRSFWCGAGALLTLAVGWLSWYLGAGASAVLYGIASVVITLFSVFIVGRRIHSTLPEYARGPSKGFRAVAIVSLVFAGLAPIGSWLSRGDEVGQLWPVLWIGGTLLVVGVLLCWGVVGLPRAARNAAASAPVGSGSGRQDGAEAVADDAEQAAVAATAPLSRWVEVGGVILALIAALAAVGVLLLGRYLGDGSQLNGWFWVFAVLVWANVLWCIPAWVTLETRAWTDDSIFRLSR